MVEFRSASWEIRGRKKKKTTTKHCLNMFADNYVGRPNNNNNPLCNAPGASFTDPEATTSRIKHSCGNDRRTFGDCNDLSGG